VAETRTSVAVRRRKRRVNKWLHAADRRCEAHRSLKVTGARTQGRCDISRSCEMPQRLLMKEDGEERRLSIRLAARRAPRSSWTCYWHIPDGCSRPDLFVEIDRDKIKAMEPKDLRLFDLLRIDEAQGTIFLHGQRMIVVNADDLGLLRKELITTVGTDRARGILVRFG
jgi:hypothetical protein